MNLDEFYAFYKKYGKCINQIQKPKHELNDREIAEKFAKYNKLKEKKIKKGTHDDIEWKKVSDFVWLRDKSQCRLFTKLTKEESTYVLYSCPYNLVNRLDLAHVIPRSESKNLYYNPDNIVLLSRVFHSRLDTFHDPITGHAISVEEHTNWWKIIVGEDNYNSLLKMK